MLLITIHPGTTEEARQELTCYYNAFECNPITTQDPHTVTILAKDADTLPAWLDMEHNTVTDYTTEQGTIIAAIMAAA